MRHIRCTNDKVKDQRFRCTAMYTNKMRPTLCGADPTSFDLSKDGGRHVIKCATEAPARLGYWLADVCPDCIAKSK